jgi:acetyl/propionyl-CoA carboxylase alpha subunit
VASFGDGGLLIEKLVTEAHHVEVQVLGDTHGNLIHLGERDCSVQRRHQKLIEESPSPVVDDALRAELTGAALKLARAVNYVNAGTFEFLVGAPGADGKRPFYFLEVNPRLQVEHPVTEMVTGLDIVELQLRIAAGEPLPLRQEDVKFEGHAIEFRINAEDPWDGFRPSSGRVEVHPATLETEQLRIDWGYLTGDQIPGQYDSLVAKAVACATTREAALGLLSRTCQPMMIISPRCNVALGRAIARDPVFASGAATIDWLENQLGELLVRASAPKEAWAALADVMLEAVENRRSTFHGSGWIGPGEGTTWISDGTRAESTGAPGVSAGISATYWESEGSDFVVFPQEEGYFVVIDEETDLDWCFRIVPPPPFPRRAHAAAEGATAITAPLSGTIAAVRVAEGDTVEAGQPLVMLEAMKMEHRIAATADGRVQAVHVKAGDVVREGDVLVEVS